VRWPGFLAITLAASAAVARPMPPRARPPRVVHDFWRDAIEPHGIEVAKLVGLARETMKIADDALQGDAEWAVDQRMRYWHDAYLLMREAHRLSPHNPDALALLGRAADELGKTREAIDAYEACIGERGPEKAGAVVLGRLGAIYLRLGERDRGIRWLAQVPSGLRTDTAQPLVHLANALAARGEVGAAVDTLVNARCRRRRSATTATSRRWSRSRSRRCTTATSSGARRSRCSTACARRSSSSSAPRSRTRSR
jgi:hypothetical protein